MTVVTQITLAHCIMESQFNLELVNGARIVF